MQQSGKLKILGWLTALIIVLLLPPFLGKYSVFLLSLLAVYALVSLGLNLLMGYTGQIAAGHAGFLALGAYLTAIVTTRMEWLPCPLILLFAGIFTGIIGFLLGIPILRLKGFYIAMATLAFGVVVSEVILQWSSLTGGDDGFGVPTARIGSIVFDSDHKLFYLIIPVTIIMTILAKNLVNGYVGRAFIALRESEIAGWPQGGVVGVVEVFQVCIDEIGPVVDDARPAGSSVVVSQVEVPQHINACDGTGSIARLVHLPTRNEVVPARVHSNGTRPGNRLPMMTGIGRGRH